MIGVGDYYDKTEFCQAGLATFYLKFAGSLQFITLIFLGFHYLAPGKNISTRIILGFLTVISYTFHIWSGVSIFSKLLEFHHLHDAI